MAENKWVTGVISYNPTYRGPITPFITIVGGPPCGDFRTNLVGCAPLSTYHLLLEPGSILEDDGCEMIPNPTGQGLVQMDFLGNCRDVMDYFIPISRL